MAGTHAEKPYTYVILDYLDMLYEQKDHVIQTDPVTGLTDDDVIRVCM